MGCMGHGRLDTTRIKGRCASLDLWTLDLDLLILTMHGMLVIGVKK